MENAIGIVISFAGVYVILGTGELQADLMGILFSAGSVILWSAASVSIRRISEYYDPVQTALYGMAIALILTYRQQYLRICSFSEAILQKKHCWPACLLQ